MTKKKQLHFRKCCVDISGILETLNQLDIDNPEKERCARSYAFATSHHLYLYIYIWSTFRMHRANMCPSFQDLDFEEVWRFLDIYRRQSGWESRLRWTVGLSCNIGAHQNHSFSEILVTMSACQDDRAFCSFGIKVWFK